MIRYFARYATLVPLFVACLFAGGLSPSPGLAQDDPEPVGSPISAEVRAAAVDRIAELLVEHYIFPDVAEKCGAHLRAELEAGKFDQATDTEAFADALTEAMQSVSKDKHMNVWVRQPERVETEKVNPLRAGAARADEERQRNYGFVRVERLKGNVGYLDLRFFSGAPLARETAVASMAFLANTDALIFDMRKNGGGSPEMVRFLSSYLFAESTHLNSLYYRRGDRTDEYWTYEEIPGERMADVPVFVLTSDRTFSGAEEFSYNLRTQKRGTLIGETTGGGANPGDVMPIDDHFEIFVPTGRAINPITGTNWEGVGVEPHIAADADEAYDIALEKARQAAEARREALAAATDAKWQGFETAQQEAEELLEAKKPDQAAAALRAAVDQAVAEDLVGEGGINHLGYLYLQADKGPLAIAAFEANVAAFPESFNVYDSLGEAFMEAGQKNRAITNYRKSLELNPANGNAVSMLERLAEKAGVTGE